MGRIIVQTEAANPFDGDESIRCGMLVDTGAGALILPMAWKERFGTFQHHGVSTNSPLPDRIRILTSTLMRIRMPSCEPR